MRKCDDCSRAVSGDDGRQGHKTAELHACNDCSHAVSGDDDRRGGGGVAHLLVAGKPP